MSSSKTFDHSINSAFINQFTVKQVIEMFDLLPDILFWVKDKNCHFVYANQYFLDHLKASSLKSIIGLSDYDFSAPHLARQYHIDDQKVMTGQHVDNRLEMNHVHGNGLAWFTTSKRPLLNKQGVTIGSYGISRHLEKTSLALSGMDALKIPVAYIRKNYKEKITLKELANITYLSISALERRFKKYLGKTPKQFINEIRLENARRLLVETNLPIATIANETGFIDHSYFSKQFKQLFNELPSELRLDYCVNY